MIQYRYEFYVKGAENAVHYTVYKTRANIVLSVVSNTRKEM